MVASWVAVCVCKCERMKRRSKVEPGSYWAAWTRSGPGQLCTGQIGQPCGWGAAAAARVMSVG
jgi:hypothetical protein